MREDAEKVRLDGQMAGAEGRLTSGVSFSGLAAEADRQAREYQEEAHRIVSECARILLNPEQASSDPPASANTATSNTSSADPTPTATTNTARGTSTEPSTRGGSSSNAWIALAAVPLIGAMVAAIRLAPAIADRATMRNASPRPKNLRSRDEADGITPFSEVSPAD
jgi:hypothetical protein